MDPQEPLDPLNPQEPPDPLDPQEPQDMQEPQDNLYKPAPYSVGQVWSGEDTF